MKKFQIFAFTLAAFLVLPISASALGQMSQPIVIDNAMRGAQINQEIIAVNTEDKKITVEFTAGGQIADWVKFYATDDLKNSVATTTIEARANLNMIAIISVPKDAPNGEYIGAVSVTSIPDKAEQSDQSSASMAQKIDREVTITVSDVEDVSLEASVIPKSYDMKTGESLSVRIIYDNRSNVSLSPSISFKIKKDEQTVYNVIYPYPDGEPAVNPQAIQEIPALEIPTTGLANGKYRAQLAFRRGDKTILEKQFGFSIGTQSSAFATKIGNFFGGNLGGLLGLAAVILVIIIGLLVKRNIDMRKNLKLLKKQFVKGMKSLKTGLA